MNLWAIFPYITSIPLFQSDSNLILNSSMPFFSLPILFFFFSSFNNSLKTWWGASIYVYRIIHLTSLLMLVRYGSCHMRWPFREKLWIQTPCLSVLSAYWYSSSIAQRRFFFLIFRVSCTSNVIRASLTNKLISCFLFF